MLYQTILRNLAHELGPAAQDLLEHCGDAVGKPVDQVTREDLPALASALEAEVSPILGGAAAARIAERIRNSSNGDPR